ncbi:MAG: M24 family metallopeptidase [Candidatus Thioglobus sp.]|nr:MAG: M24 family metallopeptidase [Candidatus Thioglobus sp.]
MNHQRRQKKILAQLGDGYLAIIATNSEQLRNGDVFYPFRAHSDFWYLTGFSEPQAVAVFSEGKYIIFLREKDAKTEIWNGKCLGVDAASKVLGADLAYPISALKTQLPQLIKAAKNIYYDFKPCPLDDEIMHCLALTKTHSFAKYLHEMRLIKDDSEIASMQKAADISVAAHQLAIEQTKPDLFEYEIGAIFDANFRKHNATHAYEPIVAGGKNACVLHYIKNDKRLNAGELLLIDAGCEVDGYAADISRTFPINGKFSPAQRQIYQLVLDAQLAAIAAIKPSAPITAPHKIAKQVLKQGLIDLEILPTDGDLTQFYMHGTGHWLGLDVHDVGNYQQNNQDRKYKIGMVTTVEPGIYIRASDKINPIYWNIGIRIEDDVLVTKNGNRVLTVALAKEIEQIEALMQKL